MLKDSHPAVREATTKALGATGSVNALPLLVELLADENLRIRAAAALSLGRIGAGATVTVPALVKALGDDAAYVRGAAAEALAQFGPEAREAIPALESLQQDRNIYTYRGFLGMPGEAVSIGTTATEAIKKIRAGPAKQGAR